MNQNPFYSIPLVKAGFQSPAQDYAEPKLDFNGLFNNHKASVFHRRVDGDSMKDAYLPHNSVMVIDRALPPRNHSIVVGVLNGEPIVKQYVRTLNGLFLLPANERYQSIKVEEGMEFTYWGTVTHVVIDVFNHRL